MASAHVGGWLERRKTDRKSMVVYKNRVEGSRPINIREVCDIYRSVLGFPSMLSSRMTETQHQTPVVQNVVSFAKMSTDNEVLDLKLIA